MRVLRVLVPSLVILAWLGLAGVGGPYFGRIDEVASNDQTAYLPASADATLVQKRLTDFLGDDQVPAIVVFSSDTKLTDARLDALKTLIKNLHDVPGVQPDDVSPVIASEDGEAAQVFVPVDADADLGDAVTALRDQLRAGLPEGVDVNVTGPAGFSADLVDAFSGIDGLLLGVALAAVGLILIIVYRSVLLPIMVLMTSTFALSVALLINWWLAREQILVLTGQTQGILFILVIGAATDYGLLLTSRQREELGRTRDRIAATKAAWRGSVEPILASGGTVIAGLLCLLLSDLGSNTSLGPVAAIGIAVAMLSALTLLPALLALSGRAAFWPRRPRVDPQAEAGERGGGYARIARLVARRPRTIWVVVLIALLAGGVGLVNLRADGVAQSELIIGGSDASVGEQVLADHFPGGSGTPVYVITAHDDLQRVADILLDQDGVDSVSVAAQDSPSGTAPVTKDGIQPLGRPGSTAPDPTVSNAQVLLEAVLADPADSAEAEATVRSLRASLAGTALVGGVTATAIDTKDASIHDRDLIIPIVLVVIAIILMLLLRAVVVGLVLLGATVVSFAAALGVSSLLFNNVLRLPGADPAVPLYGFVFLVALGVDYNIFLMTRVREETLSHGTREGLLRGLAITGGVITSAGLVLAATFAALAVLPILFLLQIAVIVALGVLIDTFLVRTLLVPALSYDLGRVIWWPSRLSRFDVPPRRALDEKARRTDSPAAAGEPRRARGRVG